MTCDDARSVMLAFLDGRLDSATQAAVGSHLDACAACAEAAETQRQVAAALSFRPDAPVPPGFAARLAARLHEQDSWFGLADWRWLSVRIAPVAAALLIVAGLLVGRNTTASQSSPAEAVSLSGAMESWATGGGDRMSVTSVLWQPGISDDSAVLAVLAAPADATIGRQSNER